MTNDNDDLKKIHKLVEEAKLDSQLMVMADIHVKMYAAYRHLGLTSEQAADIVAAFSIKAMNNKNK